MSQFMLGLRILKRQGHYGIFAIAGLALGLAVAITALIFTWQETHYDHQIPQADNIYIIDAEVSQPGRAVQMVAQVPGGLSPVINEAVAGVKESARVWRQWSTLSLDDAFNFNEPMIAVDPNWIEMIELSFVEGNSFAMANDVTAVVISKTMAKRLFGDSSAVGKTLKIDGNDMNVAGVFEDFPTASHMEANFIMPLEAPPVTRRGLRFETAWQRFNVFTYLLLEPGANVANVTDDVWTLLERNYQSNDANSSTSLSEIVKISLQSLSDLHLNGKTYNWGIKPPADKLKLAVLSSIAILIVLIACINHINMSTVRSIERAREVALRKIAGAGRTQLVSQFIIEAAFIVGVAALVALVLVEFTAKFTGELLQADIDLAALFQPSFMLWLGGLLAFVILIAGAYPAYLTSAIMPGRILSENARGSRGNSTMRTTLVVFQFGVSIILAVGAAVIWSQLRYAQTRDLGFNSENVMMLYGVGRGPQGTINLTSSIDKAISGKPGIVSVSAANSTPSWDYVPEADMRRATAAPTDVQSIGRISVDLDFFETLNIAPSAGRLFGEQYGADMAQWTLETRGDVTLPIILNERAVRTLGFDSPESAIGELVQFSLSATDERPSEIVGVVPDVHFKSLKNAIQPMAYYPDPSVFSVMLVKIDPLNYEAGKQSIAEGWGQVMTNQAISSDMLDTALVEQYNRESRDLKTVTVLAGLGILIAVFGQYGLAAYSAQSRRREIGIRKVLGAHVRDILSLFLWQFSKPVFLAMVVAWPLAFWLMSAWLENFVYRVTINPLWFVLAGIAALSVALVTVAGHALKAARAAPVEALRYE